MYSSPPQITLLIKGEDTFSVNLVFFYMNFFFLHSKTALIVKSFEFHLF